MSSNGSFQDEGNSPIIYFDENDSDIGIYDVLEVTHDDSPCVSARKRKEYHNRNNTMEDDRGPLRIATFKLQ